MRATAARRINHRAAGLAVLAIFALIAALAVAGVMRRIAVPTVDVAVDPTQRFQRIDGFGVNANPKNWRLSDLTPAIDRLVDDLHATLWRVDIDGQSDWIDDPAHLSPDAYATVYETPDFQALWRTLAYLDQKGARVVLSASGRVPAWMGGTHIEPVSEDQFVEMIASVVDYGRRQKHVPITLLSPLNETDLGSPEGPLVAPDQYARIVSKLLSRLAELGYADVEIVGPETSRLDRAADYVAALMDDPTTMAHVRAIGVHDYAGDTGDLPAVLASSAYPDRALWMTEWSQNATDGWLDNGRQVRDEWRFASAMTDDLISVLNGGASAALAWDAFDNVHEHCGCTALSRWGLLALAPDGSSYTPKIRYATVAQVFRFVPPGWQRVAARTLDPALQTVAFADSQGTQLTLVGHTTHGSDVHLRVSVPATVAALHVTTTTRERPLAQQPDVPVTGGVAELTLPPDSFFTLTTLP